MKWDFCFQNFEIFGRLINRPKHLMKVKLNFMFSQWAHISLATNCKSISSSHTHTSHPLPLLNELVQSDLCRQTLNYMISIEWQTTTSLHILSTTFVPTKLWQFSSFPCFFPPAMKSLLSHDSNDLDFLILTWWTELLQMRSFLSNITSCLHC